MSIKTIVNKVMSKDINKIFTNILFVKTVFAIYLKILYKILYIKEMFYNHLKNKKIKTR